ncbi:MAG: hypothetical protein E6I44_14675 [Chloroflexi bacterium]|nr:MAG: hypothetical protein E6I44_14675 [Chloroflexota bacterium]
MSDKPADAPALRAKLLRAKPADFGLAATPELPRVWGAMMEMRIGAADASLVVVAEGSTSLYFSTGGGVIGGGEHESVRAANRKLLGVIEKLFPAFVAREVPVPVLIGAVSFAVFTYDGLRAARDTEERLRDKKSPLWPAYYIGQEIITALRLVTEKSTGH